MFSFLFKSKIGLASPARGNLVQTNYINVNLVKKLNQKLKYKKRNNRKKTEIKKDKDAKIQIE